MKKAISLILVITMALALGMPVFASGEASGEVSVMPPERRLPRR